MKTVQRGRRWILGLVLGLGVLILLALAFALFVDRTTIQRLAFEQIERAFGPYITVGRTELSLFPRPRLEFTDVVVKAHRDAHAMFRAQSLSMEVAFWPLLDHILDIRSLVISRPELEVHRDPEGHWRVPLQHPGDRSMIAGLFAVRHLMVDDGHVTLIDERPKEGVRGLLIDNLRIRWSAEQPAPSPAAELELRGRVRNQGHMAQFSLAGRLEAKPPEPMLMDPGTPPQSPPVAFNGYLAIQDLDIEHVVAFLALREEADNGLGAVDIQSQIKVAPGTAGYDLSLFDMTVQNPLLSFTGAIHVGAFNTENMTLSIVGSSSPISLKQIKEHVPLAWLPEALHAPWEEVDVDGMIEVVRATVIAPTRSPLGISVNGEIKVADVALHSSTQAWPSLDHVQGTILLEPDRIRCRDFTGRYDGIPVETAQALILSKKSETWLELQVQGPVPPQKVLAEFQEVLSSEGSASSVRAWQVLGGEGRLVLRLAGPMMLTASPFERVALVEGSYDVEHLQIELPHIGVALSDVSGRLRFTPEETALNDVNGWIGRAPFHLDGVIDTRAAPVFDHVILLTTVNADSLSDIQVPPGVTQYVPYGEIGGRFEIAGPLATPLIKGELDFVRAALRFPMILEKVPGVPGSLEFTIRVKPHGLVVKQLELLVLPIRISSRGLVTWSPTFAIRATLGTGSVYVGLLPDGLTVANGVLRSGILELSLDVRGHNRDWRTWQIDGWIALTEGVMIAEGLDQPLSHVFLRVKLNSQAAAIARCDFRLGESDVRMTGSITHWRDRPKIAVSVESDQFDLDQLIPKGERSPLREALELLAAETTVDARVTIARPWYQRIRLKQLTSTVTVHDGLIKFDRMNAQGEDSGTLSGRLLLHLPRGKPGAMRVSFAIQDFPFRPIEESFERGQRLVTGRLTAKGMLQGHGRHPQGVRRSLQGKVQVTLVDGYVQRGTILPRILAILNLPTVLRGTVDLTKDGFPFDQARATLTIEHGIMTARDIVIDSPIMKLTAVGSYDVANDRLDGVVAVSPFGPYSDFLKSIPLFGKILTGERKGIATALFKIAGPLDDPTVEYLPLESFATGLTGLAQLAFDILKNTVMLPTELLPKRGSAPSEDAGAREHVPIP
ncbi:MAG: AsmA family protein [Nitrospirae bacterium]|nr:MAG: AsmA family protein [Nitrospirota bacterium]